MEYFNRLVAGLVDGISVYGHWTSPLQLRIEKCIINYKKTESTLNLLKWNYD